MKQLREIIDETVLRLRQTCKRFETDLKKTWERKFKINLCGQTQTGRQTHNVTIREKESNQAHTDSEILSLVI